MQNASPAESAPAGTLTIGATRSILGLYTDADFVAHARLISLATRAYERANRRRTARTGNGWASIAALLWEAMQGPGLVLLQGERRRFVRDRYRDADQMRAQLRRQEADPATDPLLGY
jgi:hypothetical protein